MFQELRTFQPPPGTGAESCEGGSLRDSRVSRSGPRSGPFDTLQEFHVWLREDLQPNRRPEHIDDQDWQDIKEMARKQDESWSPPVFTHGDLNPFNILIHDGHVISIIDWAFAGWYPCYWEYTSAWCGNQTRQAWQATISKFVEPYPAELEMEKTRQRWWGEM